ncbi:MAG: hypothetical protein NWR72_17040 [Bacteroidia bacterium]|nr:hypothetical protein [Bacteroidia bacterium]
MKFLKTGSQLLLLILLCSFVTATAQAPQPAASLESVINRYVLTYGLSTSNRFKLASYAELKGRYDAEAKAIVLDFGGLGYLTFYERNCLLRLPGNRVYSLDHYETGTPKVAEMDKQLQSLFERIIMLSDGKASAEHIEFVDRHLSKKNLEPFDKLFIRHILVHYGKFNPMLQEVVFATADMPVTSLTIPGKDGELIRKPVTPLKMVLDATILRGWYLNSGGTVYVENVERNVRFATGEEYDHNVAAFKVFGQKLFVQSVQFLAKNEADRLATLQQNAPTMDRMVTIDSQIENSHAFATHEERKLAAYEQKWRQTQTNGVQPLYTQYSWVPMMLTLLRNEQVNIGDEDVICYFVHLDVFSRIYAQLIPAEKVKVDRYLAKEGLSAPVEGWASIVE